MAKRTRRTTPKAPAEPKLAKTVTEYPECYRHGGRQRDVKLRHIFMCDTCAALWIKDVFEGRPSIYDGESMFGYCLICNAPEGQVRMRTFPLCEQCWKVAIGIGRNHEAEQSIITFWNDQIQPRVPHLELVQTDLSVLRRRGGFEKSATAPVDFIVQVRETKNALVGIEGKAGPGSIAEIPRFQLDKSDCDTILNEMAAKNLPVYVIQSQVLQIWKVPTTGHRTAGLWWTDPYRMGKHFENVFARQDERKLAVNFGRAAFRDIGSFSDDICAPTEPRLVTEFRAKGMPVMYNLKTLNKKKKPKKKKS